MKAISYHPITNQKIKNYSPHLNFYWNVGSSSIRLTTTVHRKIIRLIKEILLDLFSKINFYKFNLSSQKKKNQKSILLSHPSVRKFKNKLPIHINNHNILFLKYFNRNKHQFSLNFKINFQAIMNIFKHLLPAIKNNRNLLKINQNHGQPLNNWSIY